MPYNIFPWYLNKFGIPRHYHSHDKNNTLLWSGSDTEEVFSKNIKNSDTHSKLEQYGWLDPIEYTYNNHGFRAEPFDDRPAGLALGCSFTEGTGLHIEQTWPSVLSKMMNTHLWNLGIGGAAFDTVFRLLDYYLLKFNPRFVCILMPPINRLEYCTISNTYSVIQANSLTTQEQYAKEWLAQEKNGIDNRRKNLLATKQLCHEANIPVFFVNSFDGWSMEDRDYARDLKHYGANVHYYLAEKFYNQMKEHYGI